MLEYIRQQRPDTKWVVHLLTNVTFYVNKLCLVVVDTVCNRSWLGFLNLGHLQPHDVLLNNGKSRDCLCRHHSIHQLKQRQGVTLDDLVVLEQVFSLNVYVYDLLETEAGDIAARLVRRSPYKCDDTMKFCFSKYGLEERLWHQSGGQTAC
jgi:hypothetical protein